MIIPLVYPSRNRTKAVLFVSCVLPHSFLRPIDARVSCQSLEGVLDDDLADLLLAWYYRYAAASLSDMLKLPSRSKAVTEAPLLFNYEDSSVKNGVAQAGFYP